MPPIEFPTVAPRATPPVTPEVEGHLAILRRLVLRARSKGGVLTPHEALMGIESVEALERLWDEKHAETLRGGNHD
jgi:hypothetical protein